MRRLFLPLLLLAASCAPSNGDSVLVDETVEIPPGKFIHWDPYTDHDCEFDFTVTPEGPGVEFWAGTGPGGIAVIDDRPSEDKKTAAAGQANVLKGSFAIGKCNANALNRGAAAVKVKCKLTTRNPPKKS